MSKPTITVLMPVFNAGDFLKPAIESILEQSFRDFEFLIINDGSTDKSRSVIESYASKDKRIVFLNRTANKGLVATLNQGLNKANGEYIARQDADDISRLDRLAKQAAFLRSNRETVIVGSSISVMDDEGQILHEHAVLLNDPELRQELLVRSPFAHGSVIFRRPAAIKCGLYDETLWPAEDYALWLKLSSLGELANLDEYLYIYREHGQGVSVSNKTRQEKMLQKVRQLAWQERLRLLPKKKIDLAAYKNLDMGEQRIGRIIDNTVFTAKEAWRHGQRPLALKIMAVLSGEKIAYKKAAGKIRRKVGR